MQQLHGDPHMCGAGRRRLSGGPPTGAPVWGVLSVMPE